MRMYDLIVKKRNGGKLSEEELRFLVKGYVAGDIPDYQMSAMLMAIWYQGMDDEETTAQTLWRDREIWWICQPSKGERWINIPRAEWEIRRR